MNREEFLALQDERKQIAKVRARMRPEGDGCCIPTVLADFAALRGVRIYLRHLGIRCAPDKEEIQFQAWYQENEKIPV